MEKALNRLKLAFEDNPLAVIAVGALAATAVAKLLDASTSARNANAWKKEVNRRDRMTR